MLISTKHKFVFLGIPRTGTTSMFKVLCAALPDAIFTGKHDMCIPAEYADYPVIACVRNPYAREVSHYLYRHTTRGNKLQPVCKHWTFAQYVRWNVDPTVLPTRYRDKPQATHLKDANIVWLLRFETLTADFNALPIVQKLKIQLPKRNVRLGDKPWQPYYTQQLAAEVYDWARLDFEKYNYDQESWRTSICI